MNILKIAALVLLSTAPVFAEGIAPFTNPPTPVEQPAGTIIDQFLAMLNGTEAAATAAIKKFGTDEVIANGMIPFGKNPKIISRDGDCVVVSLEWDGEINKYTLCESNGKISTFDWFFDEEE